jgi:hypothetical protein
MDDKTNTETQTIAGLTFDQVVGGDIFELVGMKVTDQERNDLATKMLSTIQIRVFDRIDSQLDEAGKEEFKKALESEDKSAINAFFDKQNIDYTALTVEEAAKYKIEFVTYVKMVEKSGGTLDEAINKVFKD